MNPFLPKSSSSLSGKDSSEKYEIKDEIIIYSFLQLSSHVVLCG